VRLDLGGGHDHLASLETIEHGTAICWRERGKRGTVQRFGEGSSDRFQNHAENMGETHERTPRTTTKKNSRTWTAGIVIVETFAASRVIKLRCESSASMLVVLAGDDMNHAQMMRPVAGPHIGRTPRLHEWGENMGTEENSSG
jgi:hypothetical protein